MSEFAMQRDDHSLDEIWLLQHPPVYTQGTACKQVTLASTDIPVVKSDRGGQLTYHGPGQIIMYPLLKLKRYNLGVKSLVQKLEQSVIDLLLGCGIESDRRDDAPGVYVEGAKISALGLRIRRGTSYHGLSFNIDMDLRPFNNIHPCGYKGLEITQLSSLNKESDINQIQERLVQRFVGLI
ncbi:UNVERIFIED_CONTAM: hypothetical protein GTU68_065505 [Idotea baltica]|nr:hypothetical protein [Idotea baltica]